MSSKVDKSSSQSFHFKQFSILQDKCAMKVGTDSVTLGTWVDLTDVGSVLDIGSGTGVVSLIIAQRSPVAMITGVEIDPEAAAQSTYNIQQSPWKDRVKVHQCSIQDFAEEAVQRFDLIVTNPPFFTGGTFSSDEQKASVRHTVKLPHSDLLKSTRKLLHPGGKFCVILPIMEGLRFVEIALTAGFYCTQMTEVKPKINKPIERLLLCFELKHNPLKRDELIILDESGQYTEAFISLTRDFYLNF